MFQENFGLMLRTMKNFQNCTQNYAKIVLKIVKRFHFFESEDLFFSTREFFLASNKKKSLLPKTSNFCTIFSVKIFSTEFMIF